VCKLCKSQVARIGQPETRFITYDRHAKSTTVSGWWKKGKPPVPFLPLFVPTAAKPWKDVYARSSYLIPSVIQICQGAMDLNGQGSRYLHPSMPPLPVARNRPVQTSGSQASRTMLDCSDVLTESTTRQTFASMACFARLHVISLSGRSSVAFAGRY
jgi:hypothetical protein